MLFPINSYIHFSNSIQENIQNSSKIQKVANKNMCFFPVNSSFETLKEWNKPDEQLNCTHKSLHDNNASNSSSHKKISSESKIREDINGEFEKNKHLNLILKKDEEIEALKKQLHNLKKESAEALEYQGAKVLKLEKELVQERKTKEESNKVISKLTSEKEALKKEVQFFQTKIANIEQECVQEHVRNEVLKQEVAALKQEKELLTNRFNALEQSMDEQTSEIQFMQQEYADQTEMPISESNDWIYSLLVDDGQLLIWIYLLNKERILICL